MKETGVSMVEHYCFDEHEDLKRAAMECLCNLVMDESVSNIVHISTVIVSAFGTKISFIF